MNQMMKTTTSSDIAALLNFPEKGEILSGNKVIETETKYKDNVFRYRITFPKNVRRSDIPNILREFYNTSLFTINSVDHVVENHDYQTRTTRNNTVILGSMQITPLSLTNPVAKQLTALQDFDNEYEKMVMTSPETYFRVFAYRGFDGPSFRSKLFSFVSNMGENYGYCDDKSIYHRRASLVMPKIKITKAPEKAKMFYHTHPKRDEPSLSSADDFLLYFDMSHKPRNIRHFYTVMADRMDYFHVVPKPSKKKDYVKIDEDKFIAGLDAQIDEAGKRLDETMSNETYADDLLYCEKVTREVVKWLNKTYGKYFTITYKCHYKVKKNPEEPTGSDLHLEDAFIAKALKDLKTGTASWPDFGPKDRPEEKYAYWHSKYFTMNKDVKGVGYMGLLPGDDRRLTHFLYSNYRGSEYTYDDILGILCISNDIKIRDAKIRDGKEVPSRIVDILDYLEITNEEIREDIMLYDAVVAVDAYGSLSEVIGEEHNFILPIADFSIKSVEAMDEVRSGKKELNRAKYDIMVTLKEKMGKAVADALGKRNRELRNMSTPVAVYGQDGAAVSTVGVNPPVQRTRRDFGMVLPKRVFENPELLLELLEEYKKPDKDLQVGQTNAYNIAIPVENSAVSFTIQGTGNVQIFVPSKGYPMPEDSDEAVLQAVRTLVEKLNTFDFNIDTSDIAFGTIAPMRNPNAGTIIAITGLVSSTKNKFIDSLSKRMNASVVTTITTKTLKESEKRPNIVEVSDDIFTKMEINGELAVVTESLAGYKRGFSRRDMQKGDYMLVDARIQDLHFLINAKPSVISFFLHPTNTEAIIESYLSDSVSPQEAKRVAGMIDDTLDAAEGEVEHIIEYDIERPAAAIEEVYNIIPKPNPMPKSIGSMMVSSNGNYYLRVRNNPSHNSCPAVTQNLELNTKNRNSAIKADYIKYGPLNLADEDYWVKAAEHWNTTPEVAKESKCGNCVAFDISSRMLDCMPGSVQDDGQLGMCWMHNFKCHSARTCYTWAAGGPITEDSVSYDWQERSAKSNPQKKISIRIDESTNPEKKLMAVFTKPNGRTKTIHFGARGMSDYTQHKDKSRRKNYLARHGGMGEDWNDPMTAGALSRWILWGKPSLRDSFNDFKKRFNLEGVMAVTNTKMNPRKYKARSPPHLTLIHDFDGEPDYLAFNFHHKDQDSIISHLGLQPVSKESITPGGTIPEGYKKDDFGYSPLVQANDYVPIKTEDGLFPADAKIAPLIQHLLDSGLTPDGWSEANDLNPWGYITFDWNYSRDLDEIKSALKDYPDLLVAPDNTFNFEQNQEILEMMKPSKNPRIPKKYEGQDPSEHSDLYTDEDPIGTIQGLGFKDKATAEKSIRLIKNSGKTHAHKIQAAMAMEQRARFHPHATKGIKDAQKIYAAFIEEMKKKTKRNPPWAVFIVGKVGDKYAATTRDDGRIGLPGGKVDVGESGKVAVMREATEEGWSFPKETNLTLIHQQDVEGNPIDWYMADTTPSKLSEYKEKHRGIKPILITEEELRNSGFGNENLPLHRKNPMAPGYQSYSWTTEDWRSIKVNNKGEIDYKEKCGAEGTQTPDGSPRLCLPVEVIRSLLRTESGKDVIRTQARKKARAKKGERVPWHPRIKKIWKRVKEQSPKDNPPSKVIIVSGPSGSGKSTISKTIAKELGGTLVPTVTTRSRRPKEKEGEDRIFVSKDEFKEMIDNNEFVEYKQHKDGVFYGRRKTDMDDISIVEVSLKGMKEYKKLYPDSFAVFLEPDKSPKEIEKRLLSRGGMSEANAKARASIIPKQVAAAKTMPYDLFTKSRTGKYSEVAKEIISQIPMANPGWRHGEAMDEEDDPFADQFEA